MIEEERFWKIVESVRGEDGDSDHAKRLVAKLRKLPASDIVSFAVNFHGLHDAAHRGDVWAAGLLLNHGHATDDGFQYFRNWLISRGRAIYAAALKNADSLSKARVPLGQFGPETEFESFGYAPATAYEEVTGKNIYKSKDWKNQSKRPVVEKFEWQAYTDEVLAQRLPRLWKKYGTYKNAAAAHFAEIRKRNEVKEGEQVSIKGLGLLRVGGSIRHKNYGIGRIKSMTKCIGSAVVAQVVFSDGEHPMYITGDSDLWSPHDT